MKAYEVWGVSEQHGITNEEKYNEYETIEEAKRVAERLNAYGGSVSYEVRRYSNEFDYDVF